MSDDPTSAPATVRRPDVAVTAPDAITARRRVGGLLQAYGLIAVILLVAIGFGLLTDGTFLSSRNVPILLRQAAVTGIVAVGVSLVIIAGEIDLSIGSAVGLCAIVVAWLMKVAGWDPVLAAAATITVGLVIGVWQGAAVAWLGIPSFVVTLGGLLVFQGIGLVITEGNTIASFPASFLTLAQGSIGPALAIPLAVVVAVAWLLPSLRAGRTRAGHAGAVSGTSAMAGVRSTLPRAGVAVLAVGVVTYVATSARGLPTPVLLMVAVALALHLLAARTRFGRHLYATGGNREAASLAGIAVKRVTFATFVLMGGLYALTGMVLAARLNGAPPGGAPFLELNAIAAAVIGGVSLRGGVGRVGNALLGALLLAAVSNGLSLMNVPTFYQLIVSGLILIVAVYLDGRARGATR